MTHEPQVRSKVLDIIASDPGLQQTELVFLGLFGRCVGGPRGRAVWKDLRSDGWRQRVFAISLESQPTNNRD
jgi:hypothetical protein